MEEGESEREREIVYLLLSSTPCLWCECNVGSRLEGCECNSKVKTRRGNAVCQCELSIKTKRFKCRVPV